MCCICVLFLTALLLLPGVSSEETDNGRMWSFVLYVMAILVGILLYCGYEPKGDDKETEGARRKRRKKSISFRFSSLFAMLGLSVDELTNFRAFSERFKCFSDVSTACRNAGLDSLNMIVAIDFTSSNEWQGRKTFSKTSLHRTGSSTKNQNPYQRVIWMLGKALKQFTTDSRILAYGFGDTGSTDKSVFAFHDSHLPCQSFQEVLGCYSNMAKRVTLAGPTSFAPIIRRAIEIVKMSQKYHVLVIITDRQVTEEKPTTDAVVEASNHPLSIIVVGVGDGLWDDMDEVDNRLPKRKFDNFHFIDFHKVTLKSKNPDTALALHVLMEIPDQYKAMQSLGYLNASLVVPQESVKSLTIDSCGDGIVRPKR